jgi:putative oxidoreductase
LSGIVGDGFAETDQEISVMKKFFAPGNDSVATSMGLLTLRLWLGLTMLLHHGLDKLSHFKETAPNFPDLLGIGHPPVLRS